MIYKSARYTLEGADITETEILRAGGAADPTGQMQSRKLYTTAHAAWLRPLGAEPYARWNTTVGSPVTATIYGMAPGVGVPIYNDDIWMDILYLGTPTTQGVLLRTTKADFLAAGTSVASDASAWTGYKVKLDGPTPIIGIVLSSDKLTTSHTQAVNNNSAKSSMYYNSGKYYYEVTTKYTGSLSVYLGVTTVYTDLTTIISPLDAFGALLAGAGTTWIYNRSSSNIINLGGTPVDPARPVISFAVDLTNKLGWVRLAGGNWNGNGSANPATGVGGIAILSNYPNTNFAPFVRHGVTITDAFTFNFGQSGYTYAVPSGFTNFSGATPFKLTATFVPLQVGYIHARVRVGKPGATYIIDPQIVLT